MYCVEICRYVVCGFFFFDDIEGISKRGIVLRMHRILGRMRFSCQRTYVNQGMMPHFYVECSVTFCQAKDAFLDTLKEVGQ